MKTQPIPSIDRCAFCEEVAIHVQCKLCRAWLYCSKDCSKKDSKMHKKVCPRMATAIQTNSQEGLSARELPNFVKHVRHLCFLQPTSTASAAPTPGIGAESTASEGGTVTGTGMSTGTRGTRTSTRGAVEESKTARLRFAAEKQAAFRAKEELELGSAAFASKKAASEAEMPHLEAGTREVRSPTSARYIDKKYWEERYAKHGRGGETFEWYIDYPGTALREAFPPSVREKKMLVIGCGNSELSERMCFDGFKDVDSIDFAESAIAQMKARTPRFDKPGTTCRYTVMDACHLEYDASTFCGVVDKGTLDTVLSAKGGMETPYQICSEAMRVLEPGGKFVVVSNWSHEQYKTMLLSMCGPQSSCGEPLLSPVADPDDPPAYVYIVCKPSASRAEAAAAPAAAGQALLSQPRVPPWPGGEVLGSAAFALGQRGAQAGTVDGDRGDHDILMAGAAVRSSDGSPVAGPFVNGGPSYARPFPTEETPVPDQRGRPDDAGVGEVERRPEGSLHAQSPAAVAVEEALAAADAVMTALAAASAESPADRERLHLDKAKAVEELNSSEAKIKLLLDRIQPPREGAGAPVLSPPAPPTVPVSAPVRTQSGDGDGASPSLPWGARETFDEDKEFANYDLIFGSELRVSEVAVEIAATRLKIRLGRRPGAGEEEVVLDRELHGRADPSESTWSIQDKTVLSVSLCKQVPGWWRRVFKSSKPEPKKPPVAAHGSAGGGRWRERPVSLKSPASPFPAPPSLPRKHEQSPKSALLDARKFTTPERFFLQDLTMIKKLRIHLSKPSGFRVNGLEAVGVGGPVCKFRIRCRDNSGKGLPDIWLLQIVDLGRDDYDLNRFSFDNEADDDLCVVVVHYGEESVGGGRDNGGHGGSDCGVTDESGGAETDGLDDEGVSRVAGVTCRFCGHPFTERGGNGLTVRAMPSGRWDDCIEDMICYDGPSATPMLAQDVNYARPGRCLMGHAEVLLHSRDLIKGAVAVVDDPGAAAAKAVDGDGKPSPPRLDGSSDASIDEDGPDLWRSIECARCDLPLGRPATPMDGSNDAEGRGFLLLKHCLLADEVGAATGGGGGSCSEEDSDVGKVAGKVGLAQKRGEGAVSTSAEGGVRSIPRVFANRTVITWLMGEMGHSNLVDGCTRFILAARGRARSAPAGCLSMLLAGTHNRVSENGEQKPRRAHKIGFREESRELAEKAHEDEEKRAGGAQGGQASAEGGDGDVGRGAAVTARVPARVLEVSYGEYGMVRRRLLETAWVLAETVAAPLSALDSRGYSYGYLF